MNETTIIVPVSRTKFLTQFFASLNALECDVNTTRLLVMIDGDLRLYEKAQLFVVNSKFIKREIVFRHKGLPSDSNVRGRRKRIADIHNEIKQYVPDCEYVFLLEDDTLIPSNALSVLLDDYELYPNAGFVSGIEIGRWGFPMIGAWKKQNDTIESVKLESSIVRVSAAGLYCCLTKREHYVNNIFEPYEKILGPDVDFGISLSLKGYENYIDYDIKCEHLVNKNNKLTFDNINIVQVKFTRDESSKLGWSQEIIGGEQGCEFC